MKKQIYKISGSLWYCEYKNGNWIPLFKLIPE